MDDVLFRQRRAHPSATKKRFKAWWGGVKLFWKTYQDTPPDLRWILPPANVVVLRLTESFDRIFISDMWTGSPVLARAIDLWTSFRGRIRLPKFIRQPFHPDRLRRHWKAIKSLVIGPRTL
jgi:hypothetical protein